MHGSDLMSFVVNGVWVLIHDSLAFEGNVGMLMGLSMAGSLRCMLPDSLILQSTYCLVVYALGAQGPQR